MSEAVQVLLGGADFLPEPVFPECPEMLQCVTMERPLHTGRIAGERKALARAVCMDLLAGRSKRAIAAEYRLGRETIDAIERVMRQRDELRPLAQVLTDGLGQCIVLMLFRLREALVAGEFSPAQIPIALGVLIDKKGQIDAGVVPGTERTVEGVSEERARAYLELVKLRAAEGVSGGNGANGPIIEAETVRDTGSCAANGRPGGVPATVPAATSAATGPECGGGGSGAGGAAEARSNRG